MANNRIDDYQEEVTRNVKTNLVRLRKASKLSKRDVAEVLGINENTYRIWEDPKRSMPKMHNLVRIAQIYKVSCDFLLTNHDKEEKPFSIPVGVRQPDPEELNRKYLSSLDKYERLIVMKIRQLDPEERSKINNLIEELLEEQSK